MYKKTLLLTLTGMLSFSYGRGNDGGGNIDRVLRSIEANNKELRAKAQWTAAQKLEDRTENNLADPSLSYAHLWKSKDKSETIGELVVSQSFDFPSLYATRRQLNRLKAGVYDNRALLFREELLLQAKETCLDIILLRRQKKLLDERLRNAEELSEMYARRLEAGDANILEMNKIKLELLNARTEVSMNKAVLNNLLQKLNALNANLPVDFDDDRYPDVAFPADYQALKAEVMASDRTLAAFEKESLTAHKQVTVNRSQWLPKFELGYRRNTESGTPFNGLVVGFSFPLFENRHKVKAAKAQALDIDLQKENAALQREAELMRLYREAETLYRSMQEYQNTFESGRNLDLLKQAVTGGQINMIEYFVEVSVIYQSRQNLLQLENQYQKAMARIYKGRL